MAEIANAPPWSHPYAPKKTKHKRSFSIKEIRTWADLHHERTGKRPKVRSGPVLDTQGESWAGIEAALDQGCRGLPGGCSLAKLLATYRRVRNKADLPPLNR